MAKKKLEVVNPNVIPMFSSAVMDDGSAALNRLREQCLACTSCGLHVTRTQAVFGEGNATRPVIAFVGEGPGEMEDKEGRPFIGKSGQLLTKMIEAMGLARADIYICNVVACRPPGNRPPEEDEVKACNTFLFGQLRAVRPEVIVTLGATASRSLLKGTRPLSELRGQWLEWEGIPVRVTFHPAFLLRKPPAKVDAWKDLTAVIKRLGRSLPEAPATDKETP